MVVGHLMRKIGLVETPFLTKETGPEHFILTGFHCIYKNHVNFISLELLPLNRVNLFI